MRYKKYGYIFLGLIFLMTISSVSASTVTDTTDDVYEVSAIDPNPANWHLEDQPSVDLVSITIEDSDINITVVSLSDITGSALAYVINFTSDTIEYSMMLEYVSGFFVGVLTNLTGEITMGMYTIANGIEIIENTIHVDTDNPSLYTGLTFLSADNILIISYKIEGEIIYMDAYPNTFWSFNGNNNDTNGGSTWWIWVVVIGAVIVVLYILSKRKIGSPTPVASPEISPLYGKAPSYQSARTQDDCSKINGVWDNAKMKCSENKTKPLF